MAKRTLKRQLNLVQVIMLGTAGTLGSGIFILTGHAAGVGGSATVLAVIIAGLLSFSIALNYCELATTYPETGGAMTYVREAWGKGLLSFLVGSMDCISSTFYCALSAVGFAYSLSVFFPAIPIVPVAIGAILVFMVLNILGVTNVGNIQIVMGIILLVAFTVYIVAGFTSPNGFNFEILLPQGQIFQSKNFGTNLTSILRTIALIYALYVGFEVIADDAEEVKNPTKNIPIAIIVSLILITVIYTLTVTVALGTTPWQQLAGSETALSDTIRVFLPGLGVSIIGIAGMVGALTSVNSSMLSATRESFTLSRDGAWPAMLSRLNKARVPFMAIVMIAVISIFITGIGLVNFLSYITSAGYLFVLFFSNMAMIKLRKKYPFIHRPFKVPLFPLTPIMASLTCLIVICFSEVKALIFTAGIIGIFATYYYVRIGVESWQEAHTRSLSPGRYRLVVPFMNDSGLDSVMKIGASLAEAKSDMNMCLLMVMKKQPDSGSVDLDSDHQTRQYLLEKFVHYAVERNVPLYSKTVSAETMADGILEEIHTDNNVRLLLFRWPDSPADQELFTDTMQKIIKAGVVNVGVLYDKGVDHIQNVLVPVGGGYHCKLAIHIADDLANIDRGNVDFLRVAPSDLNKEEYEDQLAYLQEVVMTELGNIPGNVSLHIEQSDSPTDAIIEQAQAGNYDLLIIGSSEAENQDQTLFGSIVKQVRINVPCSTLVIRQHESVAASWLRRQFKASEHNGNHTR
ncbi:MAG: amino acid permease [Anaerolineaceae bacterium]